MSGMWAEARKHEKKVRGIVIDMRKRAERRRAHFDAVKEDPASFLRIHGNGIQIHLSPSLAEQADSAMMKWNKSGNDDDESGEQIDRFDVRANLDDVPVENKKDKKYDGAFSKDELSEIMYERYRELIHNDFRGLEPKMALAEIKAEESYERQLSKKQHKGRPGQAPSQAQQPEQQKAAISFTYDEGEVVQAKEEDEDSDDSDDDNGLALIEEAMNPAQLSAHDKSLIDNKAMDFKIGAGVFIKLLKSDRFHLEEKRAKMAEELEQAAQDKHGNRHGRRRKRRERKFRQRIINELPSYAKKQEDKEDGEAESSSASSEEENEGPAKFITSFGGSSEDEARDKKEETKERLKIEKKKRRQEEKEADARRQLDKRRYRSRTRSRSRSRSRDYRRRLNRRSSRSRTRSRSKSRRRDRRHASRSRSRSRDRRRRARRSRSPRRTRRSSSTPPRKREKREELRRRKPSTSSSSSSSSSSSASSDTSADDEAKTRKPGVEPGRAKRAVGPVTPAQYKRPVTTSAAPSFGGGGAKMSASERVKMMIAARLNNTHEKEKVKRQIREEESEDAKRERQREWRNQLIKQKERGHIHVDIDRFTNDQMERMIFDKSYNPFKKEPDEISADPTAKPAIKYDASGEAVFGSDDEDADEAARKKAELRARFNNA